MQLPGRVAARQASGAVRYLRALSVSSRSALSLFLPRDERFIWLGLGLG